MNIEEMIARESIRKTMAQYTIAGDRLRADEFIAVFTDDAVLESEGVPDADAFRYTGRGEIQAWIKRWPGAKGSATDAQRATAATFVRHHLSTSNIEITGADTAKARTYWVAYTDIGPDHCGYYLDQFRKVEEGWLIAHRKVRLDWRSPASLFASAIARTK